MTNFDKIKLIREYLIRDHNVQVLINKIAELKKLDKYRIEIGKVLFSNGIKNNEYIITPYNIAVSRNREFICEMSFCYGDEIMSCDYFSKFEHKEPISIMNGYIFFLRGELNESYDEIKINQIDILQWPTDIPLDELKKLAGGEPSQIEYEKTELESEEFEEYNSKLSIKEKIEVSNLGRVKVNGTIVIPKRNKKGFLYILDDIFVHKLVSEIFLPKPIGFTSQIHHIDNNGYNNRVKNLINITYEQHPSIHLFMWKKYRFENGTLKISMKNPK
jgi:SepF-like predicted cell division protein (DUF552 family)